MILKWIFGLEGLFCTKCLLEKYLSNNLRVTKNESQIKLLILSTITILILRKV